MATGEETRGQVARTMAGAEGVEIKATIPHSQVDLAMKLYKLKMDDNERFIYFFDTPDLELFETGIIARRGGSSAASTTARSSFGRSCLSRSRPCGENTAASSLRPMRAIKAWSNRPR